MKVTLEKNYREHYTLADVERAKAVIACEKEDEMSVKGWAEYAVREALKGTIDYCERVLEATATTARNCRAWNTYTDGSWDMDVWVKATAKTSYGFIEIGAYLSDIWETGAKSYKEHMYIQYYGKAEL